MSCDVKYFKAKLNTKQYLVDVGAISSNLDIVDINKFREANQQLQKGNLLAYNIEGKIWKEESNREGIKAVPNESLLNQIDEIRKELGLYDTRKAGYVGAYKKLSPSTGTSSLTVEDLLQSGEITYTDEEGNICAKSGLRKNQFTRGSEWSVAKDLTGYPSHSNGGVDLTFNEKGISFRRGESDIKAEHGLLLPAIKMPDNE